MFKYFDIKKYINKRTYKVIKSLRKAGLIYSIFFKHNGNTFLLDCKTMRFTVKNQKGEYTNLPMDMHIHLRTMLLHRAFEEAEKTMAILK
jgi:hypothetical protein